MSKTKTAIKIFRILVEKGELNRSDYSDLFVEYLDPEIQDILNEFEEEMDCSIKKINNTLYLLPDCENALLGYRNKQFREWFGSNAALIDVYLSYYITMFILYKFYNGKNRNPKQLEFLRITTLIEHLDKRFELILKSQKEEVENVEEEVGLNIRKVAENWSQKISDEENKRKTKFGTIKRICSLLEQEKLIYLVDNDNEIRTTRKLDDIMSYYYLNDSRISEINSIFTGGEQNA